MSQSRMQDELIIRHLTGEASAEEEKQLERWLAQLPENEQHYLSVKKVFDLGTNHLIQNSKQQIDVDVDQEWNTFVTTLSNKEKPARTLAPDNGSWPWMRIAATFLLLVVSGFVINYFVFRNANVQFETHDNTQSVVLPDGSKVELNKHTKLFYGLSFGEELRRVELNGEAFFEVMRDVNKPFVIQVGKAEVEVLGTSFNIQGYEDRKELEVVVQTGLVKFSLPNLKQEVQLTAGFKGVYTKSSNELISTANNDINFHSWNTRKIVFIENDLRTVIETLNKTYQVNIILPANVPASCVVTVTFDHQSLESVLNVLKTTLNLEYKVSGKRIEIISAGC